MELKLFDSVSELISHSMPRVELQDPRFVGRAFQSLGEIEAAARNGWPEGVGVINGMVRELEESELPQPISRRRVRSMHESEGDDVDVDRLREGRPYWQRSSRAMSHGPSTLTIVVDVGGQWRQESTSLLWRGAAATALIILLERVGYRVEAWVYDRSKGAFVDESGCLIAACAKGPGDVVDVSTLAAAVSGWFLRTITFGALRQSVRGVQGTDDLGTPTIADADELRRLTPDSNLMHVTNLFNRSAALEFCRKELQRLCEIGRATRR